MNESTRQPSKAAFVLEFILLVACLVLFLVYAAKQGAFTISFLRAWWAN